MGLLKGDPPQRYLELIKQFRLIDDTFFNICLDDNDECMQLLLRIFLNRNDIIVKEVITQRSAHNLYGRGVRFDVIAVDSVGKIYNVEIQRSDEGANPKRARFNSVLIDSREINKNTEYKDFPETWVIFVIEKDLFGAQLPMYHIERTITELNQSFDDAAHIIYVNGEYRGNDALGRLMQDFFCPDPAKMHYPELAKRVDFFKHESKGVNVMCEIMEKLQAEGRREGRLQATLDFVTNLLAMKMPYSQIAQATNISVEEVEKIAKERNLSY